MTSRYNCSPGHWVVNGYTVSKTRATADGRKMWRIYLTTDVTVVVRTLDRAEEVLNEAVQTRAS